MAFWRSALLVPLLCLGAAPVAADQFDEARAWLERMAVAMREQDYQGTFIYVRGEDVETVRVTHVHRDGVEREHLEALTGPAREVFRDGAGVRQRQGDAELAASDPLMSGGLFPRFSMASLERARARYVFEIGGQGRIAGHEGRKLSITPRDRYRYGYEIWIEEDSGLLLRWVLYDANRRPLAKLMFTDLATGDQLDSATLAAVLQRDVPAPASSAPPERRPPMVGPASPETSVPARGDRLPPGFLFAGHARDPDHPSSEHLVFSDGLASVSVYVEPDAPENGIPEGLSRMGLTNAWSMRQASRRITAVGEVPPITLKEFGQAFLEAPPAD